jgi:glutathione S-transferase
VTAPAILYAVPASHPCAAVEEGLRLKQIAYQRRDQMFGLSPFQQLARFGARTVPALDIDGQKVVGSRLCLRTIDGMVPDPPLVPAEADHRRAVDEADRWGDVVLQEHVRWITLTAVAAKPDSAQSFMAGSSLPELPDWALRNTAGLLFGAEQRILGHPPHRVRDEYLPALPGHLDHVDRLIADEVIGAPRPTVADLQLGSSIRLLLTLDDLRPAIEERPCGRLARRLFPHYPGRVPAGAIASPLHVRPR